ncbi:hypothetical protein KZ810_03400 [Sphingomonas sp. RHCKR47]|uniref:hypothetical protein n=1 Tax=Sphingomonas citricola TaxID=2862498 RepID=UPI001CA48074|nr:hypothetical protein [Sphingomonas citricola]MBW6522533.1 hypothetical protein [Sphingomonas citricola]
MQLTDQYAITPRQAVALLEPTGVADATKLICDRAAAGLLRSYALSQVSIDARGERRQVRGAAVAPSAWERIVSEGIDGDVWSGGTVRLPGSDLIGGLSALLITGVSFHPADVLAIADEEKAFEGGSSKQRQSGPPEQTEAEPLVRAPTAEAKPQRQAPDLDVLQSGALLLTVKQTEAALARGRTWIYARIKEGKLERPPGDTRITAASVRRCAGLDT